MTRRLWGILIPVLVAVPSAVAPALAATAQPAPSAQTFGFDAGGTGDKAQPVNIAADNGIEWRQADRVYIARGNVKAVRGKVTVYADEMRAYYRAVANRAAGKTPGKPQAQAKPPASARPPKSGGQAAAPQFDQGPTEIYRLEAVGNVRFVTPTQTGYGDDAEYNVDTAILLLTGKHLKIVTAHDTLTARDSIEWYEKRQLGVARGNAVDFHDGKTLAADVLMATIVHPPGEEAHASRIDARGNVLVSSKDEIGRGDVGVYDVKTGVVTLSGHVRLTRGKDEMRGNYGVVDVNRNVGYLLPRAPGRGVAGAAAPRRVEALIVPDREDGTPAAVGKTSPKKRGTGKNRQSDR